MIGNTIEYDFFEVNPYDLYFFNGTSESLKDTKSEKRTGLVVDAFTTIKVPEKTKANYLSEVGDVIREMKTLRVYVVQYFDPSDSEQQNPIFNKIYLFQITKINDFARNIGIT